MDPEKMRKGKCFRVENTHTLEVARGSLYREKTKTFGGGAHLSNGSFHYFAIKATRHYGGLILTVFELMKGLNTTHNVHNDPPV